MESLPLKKLTPSDLPDWPRLLSRELAAAYLGVSVNTFLADVRRGSWPAPLRHGAKGGRVLWDRRALDRALDIRSGLSPESPFEQSLGDAWGNSA